MIERAGVNPLFNEVLHAKNLEKYGEERYEKDCYINVSDPRVYFDNMEGNNAVLMVPLTIDGGERFDGNGTDLVKLYEAELPGFGPTVTHYECCNCGGQFWSDNYIGPGNFCMQCGTLIRRVFEAKEERDKYYREL